METKKNTSKKQAVKKKKASTAVRNAKGQVIAGTPNPNGRPKGRRNFVTDFEEAIIGLKDKETGEQLTMKRIVKTGIVKMLKGDARFEYLYTDLLDRYYGKPKNNLLDIGDGEDDNGISSITVKIERD